MCKNYIYTLKFISNQLKLNLESNLIQLIRLNLLTESKLT